MFRTVFEYLKKKFGLDDSEIKNFAIRGDDTVRFSIYSANAHSKALEVSNAVSSEIIFK